MDEKECTHCGEFKAMSEYYRNTDGSLFGKCKECAKRLARERFQKKKDQIREQRRQYAKTEKGRRMIRECNRRDRQKNRKQHRAREAVREKLPPASKKCCVHCGAQAHGYHHHNGYDREHRFDVIPLCRQCHHKADAEQRARQKAAES